MSQPLIYIENAQNDPHGRLERVDIDTILGALSADYDVIIAPSDTPDIDALKRATHLVSGASPEDVWAKATAGALSERRRGKIRTIRLAGSGNHPDEQQWHSR